MSFPLTLSPTLMEFCNSALLLRHFLKLKLASRKADFLKMAILSFKFHCFCPLKLLVQLQSVCSICWTCIEIVLRTSRLDVPNRFFTSPVREGAKLIEAATRYKDLFRLKKSRPYHLFFWNRYSLLHFFASKNVTTPSFFSRKFLYYQKNVVSVI